MPAIIPVTFLGLISRYIYFKIAFIKYSRVPKVYNEALNMRVLNIIKITLILRLMFGIWIYGAYDIFAEEISIFETDWVKYLFIAEYCFQCYISFAISCFDSKNVRNLVLFNIHAISCSCFDSKINFSRSFFHFVLEPRRISIFTKEKQKIRNI